MYVILCEICICDSMMVCKQILYGCIGWAIRVKGRSQDLHGYSCERVNIT